MKTRRRHSKFAAGLLSATLLAIPVMLATPALAGGRWLHVRVEDRDHRPEHVSVNVPVAMVASLLPMIEAGDYHHGRIELDEWIDSDVQGIDLREILDALRDAPDSDFITVRSDGDDLRVAKRDGLLVIRAENRDRKEHVRVSVPLDVVDALLDEDPDRLDLSAAFERLADYDGGDLVTVESEDTTVRVWIDDSDTGR